MPTATAQSALDVKPLLEGLQKALDGQPRLLQGKEPAECLFPAGKPGNAPVEQALAQGYIEPCSPPAGKKATARQKYVRLTAAGRQFLFDHLDPRAALETLLPVVEQLNQRVQQLQEDVQRLVAAQLDGINATLNETVRTLQRALMAAPALGGGTAAKAASSEPATPAPATAPTRGRPLPITAVLRQAYDRLCLSRTSSDGLVELPRLYHEAHKGQPTLTPEQFLAEVQSLWKQRRVELHILNEVDETKEPELAIDRDDRLYYYLFWKTP